MMVGTTTTIVVETTGIRLFKTTFLRFIPYRPSQSTWTMTAVRMRIHLVSGVALRNHFPLCNPIQQPCLRRARCLLNPKNLTPIQEARNIKVRTPAAPQGIIGVQIS
jgi:hypothetical protein